MDAQSRVVIVTGGADGFGAAIVDKFISEGCYVHILDINRARGEAKAKHSKVTFQAGDVADPKVWSSAVDSLMSNYGRLDVVINNAGITADSAQVHTMQMETYDRIFNLNVKPIFISAQVVVPVMLKQGSGIFINISSTGYTRPRPGFAFYNASKAAVAIATKTMALEYAPTIRFNSIAPAVGNTAMLRASIGDGHEASERLAKILVNIPMKRVTEPDDVANAAWFLASKQSSFITGTVLEVDGGRGV